MEILGNIKTITVSTSSDETYVFFMKEDKISFRWGMMEGVITQINQPIKLGGKLDFHFHKHDIHYPLQQSAMCLNSTPITKIVIE